ncbi:MAG: hypothetical protein QOI20_3286 [Acidimicrobiaceae bacterium]|jgi:hypothetical protein|nr:hypothetical protein [Acidimicrobiaceae bacterium]
MGNYAVEMRRTASATASLGNITAPASGMRRFRLYDLVLGADGAAADNAFLYQLQRCTTTGTRTAVTPQPLDTADPAAVTTAGQNHTVEPTYTAAAVLLSVALNQRSTFRWCCDPQDGLIVPATANNGIGIQTPAMATVAITGSIRFRED